MPDTLMSGVQAIDTYINTYMHTFVRSFARTYVRTYERILAFIYAATYLDIPNISALGVDIFCMLQCVLFSQGNISPCYVNGV